MASRPGASRCITDFFSAEKTPSTSSHTVTDARDYRDEESDISESSDDDEDNTVNGDQYDASHSSSTSTSQRSNSAPPATKRPKRSFQSKWLSKYQWLVFKDHTLFCLDAGMQNALLVQLTCELVILENTVEVENINVQFP